jgi:hypothetical protein
MSSLQSFEMAYEREGAAAKIVQVLGHQVCEGYRMAEWAVPDLGATCMLHYYGQRQIFQDGETVAVPTPFYLLHATYDHGGQSAVLRVDFETNFSIPTRKTIENRSTHGQLEIDWDLAMGICDELMRAGYMRATEKSADMRPAKPAALQLVEAS